MKKMTIKKSMKCILLLIFIALLLIGCKQQDQELSVGFIAPLSGPLANFGVDIKDGVSLFEKNHEDFSVVYEDDTFDPKESITAYRKLRDVDNINWIVGPFGPPITSAIYGEFSSINGLQISESLHFNIVYGADYVRLEALDQAETVLQIS